MLLSDLTWSQRASARYGWLFLLWEHPRLRAWRRVRVAVFCLAAWLLSVDRWLWLRGW
jgi:hypothetical protein